MAELRATLAAISGNGYTAAALSDLPTLPIQPPSDVIERTAARLTAAGISTHATVGLPAEALPGSRRVRGDVHDGSEERSAVAEGRLVTEALVTGALELPNIVPIYELGVDEAGGPMMVMKRIEGRPEAVFWVSAATRLVGIGSLTLAWRAEDSRAVGSPCPAPLA